MAGEQKLEVNIKKNGDIGYAYIIEWQYEDNDKSSWVELNQVDALMRVSLLFGFSSIENKLREFLGVYK